MDLLAVFALQPLGGKLDWGERVLDFMGNAPRDVGPGGVPLRRNEIGDIVEGEDMAVLFGIRGLGGDPGKKAPAFAMELHDRPGLPQNPEGRDQACSEAVLEVRQRCGHRFAHQILLPSCARRLQGGPVHE